MEVMSTGPSAVMITGDIRTIADYLEVKKVMRGLVDDGAQSLSVRIPDSPSVNSALIGFLLRLIYEDKVKLSLQVKNDTLYNMLRIMNLMTVFNVTKDTGGRK